LQNLLDGAYTVNDQEMLIHVARLFDQTGTFIEPSCAVAIMGPIMLQHELARTSSKQDRDSMKTLLRDGIHIVWATGGMMVPNDIQRTICDKGRELAIVRATVHLSS
jgi:D-serine dehydratase